MSRSRPPSRAELLAETAAVRLVRTAERGTDSEFGAAVSRAVADPRRAALLVASLVGLLRAGLDDRQDRDAIRGLLRDSGPALENGSSIR